MLFDCKISKHVRFVQRYVYVYINKISTEQNIWSEEKNGDMWPSIVTHVWNICSTFNPSMHTAHCEHTPEAVSSRCSGTWGAVLEIGALLKELTSVMVLRVVRAQLVPSYHLQSLSVPDSNLWPLDHKSNTLSIRPLCFMARTQARRRSIFLLCALVVAAINCQLCSLPSIAWLVPHVRTIRHAHVNKLLEHW